MACACKNKKGKTASLSRTIVKKPAPVPHNGSRRVIRRELK